jgi:hypothetical protein
MTNSTPPATLTHSWRRGIFALAALSLLAGCANGDFKEVKRYLVRDDIHDWVGKDAIIGVNTSTSGFELTDDERQLRDLAFQLIQPSYDRHQWYSIAGEYGLIERAQRERFDRTDYATRLFGDRYRSPSARYERLIDDIRDDTTRLPQFFETATRVLDIDRKRRQSLAFISNLSEHERNEALRRNYVNAAIVSLVRTRLHQRVASYHFALERLVLMTPTPQAAQVELALNQLQAEIARYRYPAPSWGRERSLASSD